MNKMAHKSCFHRIRHSDALVVCVVYATLLLDNVLLTAVVPILPAYFFEDKMARESMAFALPVNASVATAPIRQEIFESQPVGSTNGSGNSTEVGCIDEQEKEFLAAENLLIGVLLASKPFVQIIANTAAGPLCDKIGYDVPMTVGYVVIITSSIMFAVGRNYVILLMARGLQGIGSAFATTGALATLANRYRDDDERGRMMGFALGGLGMGVLVGPPFGSVTYEFAGKELPFLILAGTGILTMLVQLASRGIRISENYDKKVKTSTVKLLKDPYILLAAAVLMLGNFSTAVIETGVPSWMLSTMCAQKWMLGVVMIPCDFSYLIVSALCARLSGSRTRWLVCLISFIISAVGCVTLPISKTFYETIGPMLMIGIATAMVDATIVPLMGHLADIRHSGPLYGTVYAIVNAAFSCAFVLGPLLAGFIIREIGFNWAMNIVVILHMLFAPFVALLRNPPVIVEEEMELTQDDESNYCPLEPLLLQDSQSIERNGICEKMK